MTRFHFERPDGPPSSNAQNILVHLNEFVPPQGYGGGGGAPPIEQLLLDEFPDAAAAYSLRLLRTDYLGPAIRVIRSSDDAEQDIGFLIDGTLDIPALLAFVGLSDGLVRILYDQSENAIHLSGQIVTAEMPKIVIGGALQTTNAQPAMAFDGVDDVLYSLVTLSSPTDNIFTFGVWAKTDLGGVACVFNLDSPNTTINRRCFALVQNGVSQTIWDAGNTTNRLNVTNGNDLLQHQWSILKAPGTLNQKVREDGVTLGEKDPATIPTVVNRISLGRDSPTGTREGNMNFQEFVYYETDVLSDVSGIENNEIDYWKAVTFRVTPEGDQRVTPEGDLRILA